MGLAGRKVKQRIPNDPRNLGWSDDAARFGSAYLSKFGWDPSQGLGAEGDGMKTHLKVAHKLDMLGIGAAHTKDPNGIAWKQNRDFERLLAKLNGTEEADGEGTKVDGFATASEEKEEQLVKAEEGKEEVDEEAERRARKERKREKRRAKEATAEEGRKKKKKRKTEHIEESEEQAVAEETIVQTIEVVTPAANTSRVPPRGHRARFIRSKRMALTDATAMAEVLGIAPSVSNSAAISTAATSTEDTPATSPPATPAALEEIEKLTTSSKSVMDYFKEKLLAKSNAASGSSSPTTVDTEDEEAPRRGLGSSSLATLDHGDSLLPRRGVGVGVASGSSASAHPLATVTFPGSSECDPDIGGDSPTAKRKKSKNVKSTDPRVSAASEEDTTLDEQHAVDDDAVARKAAKRARKEARRLAKQGHSAAADADGSDPVPEKGSKEERRRRRKERANASVDD